MKISDIKVGEEYAIKRGDSVDRGRVTYAGRDREFEVYDSFATYTRTGARVFYTRDGGDGRESDTAPANVVCPWAEEAARRQLEDAREAAKDKRVKRLAEALGSHVAWDYRAHAGKYSDTRVVVDVEALERVLFS